MPQDRGAVQSHPAGAGAPLRETSVETVQRCQPSPTATTKEGYIENNSHRTTREFDCVYFRN